MSADFWNSTQRTKWQLTRYSLFENRRKLLLLERKMIHNGLIKDSPGIVYDANMRIYLHNLLIKLGRRLNIRQIALATAEVYLTRFLTKVSLKEINVYLLVTTCLYVACKIEECPQHIRLITSEARNLWPEYIPQDITKVAEFEFYLIEEMDSYLVIHHPYKSLLQLRDYFAQIHNASSGGNTFVLTNEELQNSWSIINDSYITDTLLLFPPHVIAITAVYITVVLNKPDSKASDSGSGAHRGHGSGPGSLDSGAGGNTGTGAGNLPQSGANNQSKGGSGGSGGGGGGDNIRLDDLMALSYGIPNNDGSASNSNNANSAGGHSINNSNSNNNSNHNSNNNNNSGGSGIGNGGGSSGGMDGSLESSRRIDQFREFLATSHINLDEVVEVLQDLINLYAVWNRYNEAQVKRSLQYMLANR